MSAWRRAAAGCAIAAVAAAITAALLGCASTGAARAPESAGAARGGPRLIEIGWDEPDTRFLREHISRMELAPFDGFVFHAMYPGADGRDSNFTWQVWGRRAFRWEQLAPALADLEATRRKPSTELFLRVVAAPGDVDWFDDFTPVETNLRLAARLARKGGCRGLFFDAEPYGQPLLWYRSKRPDRDRRSWAACARAARARGRTAMNAIQREFPDVVIIMSGTYSLPWSQTWRWRAELDESSYGLLAPFVDGMLDVARGDTKLVDGHVTAYGYREPEQFEGAWRTAHDSVLAIVADPARYRRHVEVGFGVWMDHEWGQRGWDTLNVEKNYFSPGGFERALRAALARTDRYVWLYTETARWWSDDATPLRLPRAYADAVRRARPPH